MPDDTSTALTAKPIPGALAISPQRSPMNVAPQNMAEAIEFARVMSKGGDVIRPAFRDNPGACLALALQAFRWNADPFAVANKAYLTRNNKTGETQIAYEAQLIDAIVHTAGVLSKRLRLRYEGQGTSRKCIVTGWIKGEDDPFEYESPTVAEVAVKNSPLWTADRDQQLAYYSKRAWARRHVPEILLGIYTTDEIDGQIIDVTADRIDAHAAMIQPVEAKRFVWQAADHTGEVYEFKTPENACDACRRILITAAAISPDALATAWENNSEFVATLREAEYGSDADALERLHRELAPQDSPAPDQSQQKGEATFKADGNGPQPNSDPPAGDTSAPDDPAQRSAADPSTQAPAAERPPLKSENWPGDKGYDERAELEKRGIKSTDYHEPRDEARAETPPAGAASGEGQGSPAATPSQTAERHDPFWDRDSLRIEPPTGRTGKPDYKAWSALIMPRIRQAWSIPLVNELMTANQDVIDLYASNFGSRARDELTGLFEDAKNRLSP